MVKKKQRRKRRAFIPEFKAEAVRLCRVGDRTIAQVAVALDLTVTALRDWVKRAEVDAGNGPPEALTTSKREELGRGVPSPPEKGRTLSSLRNSLGPTAERVAAVHQRSRKAYGSPAFTRS